MYYKYQTTQGGKAPWPTLWCKEGHLFGFGLFIFAGQFRHGTTESVGWWQFPKRGFEIFGWGCQRSRSGLRRGVRGRLGSAKWRVLFLWSGRLHDRCRKVSSGTISWLQVRECGRVILVRFCGDQGGHWRDRFVWIERGGGYVWGITGHHVLVIECVVDWFFWLFERELKENLQHFIRPPVVDKAVHNRGGPAVVWTNFTAVTALSHGNVFAAEPWTNFIWSFRDSEG